VTVEAQVPSSVPAAASPEGDGIVVGDGPVRVDAFIDFLCPFCRQFEEASGPALDRMVEQGAIRWVNHPLSFLDRLSTTRYSSRASAASSSSRHRVAQLPQRALLDLPHALSTQAHAVSDLAQRLARAVEAVAGPEDLALSST
jgi:predicted DsbA family dithiol-disulfide isomerase